jgi:hypothetical protein
MKIFREPKWRSFSVHDPRGEDYGLKVSINVAITGRQGPFPADPGVRLVMHGYTAPQNTFVVVPCNHIP